VISYPSLDVGFCGMRQELTVCAGLLRWYVISLNIWVPSQLSLLVLK